MDLVCLGLAVIDARRVDPHSFDSTPHERACGVEVESGKMQLSDSWRTGLRRAEVPRAIGPATAPPGSDQHNRILRDVAVRRLPRRDVGLVHTIIGARVGLSPDRKSTRLNSSHTVISYAVF